MTEARSALAGAETAVTRVLAGRYRLIRLVGHGGMGSVYEAVHVHTEKHVAVKLLSPQLSKDLKLVARFRREAMAASRLEHENCVHVDDFGEDKDGTFYIAMEFIDGHGLADELRASGPMDPDRVARIAAQLLQALDAAHAAGVLHRDLKPQNVMLMQKPSRPDIVKVVDFGIAKITTNTPEDQGALTVPGTIFGTPEYMSPEQARGEILDLRSDLYSASVVLWHMLLGRSPFRGSSVRETLMKVFTDEPPLPSMERPTMPMPAGFEAVLKKAMSKKKEDRYADSASFLDALRPYVTGGTVEVPRRPLPGLPVDGAPPPLTLDDHRAATLALPESELAPLQTAPLQKVAKPPPPKPVPQKAESDAATRFGALPPTPLPSQAAPRVLPLPPPIGVGGSAPQTASSTSSVAANTDPFTVAPRRRKRLSTAGVVVLSLAAVGALVLAAAAGGAVYAVQHGYFDAKKPVGPVMDLGKKDKVTNTGIDEKAKHDLPPVHQLDPIARDEGFNRAEKAIEAGDLIGAKKAYKDALDADPQAARALIGLATIAMQQHDWPSACDAFEKLSALDAKYARQFGPMYARAKKLRDEN